MQPAGIRHGFAIPGVFRLERCAGRGIAFASFRIRENLRAATPRARERTLHAYSSSWSRRNALLRRLRVFKLCSSDARPQHYCDQGQKNPPLAGARAA